MKNLYGPTNKVIEIDLTNETCSTYTVTDQERRMYLGGKGLGLKLLFDRLKPKIDPLSPDNMLAIMPGPLLGTGAPCTGRFDAVSKSPLTGIMVSSSCGGPFGMSLKTAGWDGLILKGKSSNPTYIYIDKNGATFNDASEFWGMDAISAQNVITKDKESAMVIGPAGENLVKFANIVSGHRFLGRSGLGAVLGSKNIKGIVAKGHDYKILPVNETKFNKVKKRAASYLKSNNMTSKMLRNFGTAANTEFTNNNNILPINNFKDGNHKDAMKVSGQFMEQKHNTKPHTCKPCTIVCGHKGKFGDTELSVPEFETIGLLGTNLGIFDSEQIAEWNQICTEMGMDTISLGGTIAWAMEATEKGLFKSNLKFGCPDGISELLYEIGHGKNELGLGSKLLSEQYGGVDFAVHVKGMEVSAYDPRGAIGQGLSYAVANRGGCHLSAYPVVLEVLFGLLNPYKTGAKADFTKFMENLYSCVNSLQTCQFTAFGYIFESPLTKYTPKPLLGFTMQNLPKIAVHLIDFSIYKNLWTSVTGLSISGSEFIRAGERIHVLERYMNTIEGISRKDDTLPDRLLNQPRESDEKKRTIPLEKMLNKYYKLRRYDNNGIPTKELLRDLSII